MLSIVALLAGLSLSTRVAQADTHTITFTNNCGKGTPRLIQGGNILSNGTAYTSNGPFMSGIAYLDTGCGFNGDNCSLIEMTLGTGDNGGTSADISLIDPHKFNVPSGWWYTGSCNGQGAFCQEEGCQTAFYKSDDNWVQVQCSEDNAGMNIIFCGSEKTGIYTSSNSTSPS